MGQPTAVGDPARMAVRARVQRLHHAKQFAANPHSQIPNKIIGSRLDVLGFQTNGSGGARSAKGSLTRATATIRDRTTVGALRHSNELPTATKSAKGSKNFTDAATHSPCRTAARLRLSARVNAHATPANTVDCHK
jgi:hypothetical protein